MRYTLLLGTYNYNKKFYRNFEDKILKIGAERGTDSL